MSCLSIAIVAIIFLVVVHQSYNERLRHTPCKIVLSEVNLHRGPNDFFEISKHCPKSGRKNNLLQLDGYYMLILQGSHDLVVKAAYNLDGKTLHHGIRDQEGSANEQRGRKRPRQGVNVEEGETGDERTPYDGSTSADRSLAAAAVPADRLPRSTKLNTTKHMVDLQCELNSRSTHWTKPRKRREENPLYPQNFYFQTMNLASTQPDDLVVVLLLHYRKGGKKLQNLEHYRLGETISDFKTIQSKLKDGIILGESIPLSLLSKLREIFPSPEQSLFSPVSKIVSEINYSVNKCDQASTFDSKSAHYSIPTPGQTNICPTTSVQEESYPFSFVGHTLNTQSKKLIVNLNWALNHKNVQNYVSKSPSKAAAVLLNLHPDTIKSIQGSYDSNELLNSPKKRIYPKRVMDSIDSSKERLIYEIMVSYYKQNRVPKFEEVRKTFVERVQLQEQQQSSTSAPKAPFQCGETSFRRILRKLGYKWGKINKRDAVLFDLRIVNWRTKYLQAVRDNDDLGAAALPYLYTDETWFDIYSRQSYGWFKKCPRSAQERRDFSFSEHKVARGPRIIIMHAGGTNGFVHEAMNVYPVSKKKVAGDYHDNVNSATYVRWFTNLLSALEGHGKHIIVIDNAPYHSLSTAPRLNSKKQVLFDWLKKQKDEGKDLPELSKGYRNLRWVELVALVRKLKKEEPRYRVDEMAKEKGHRVLRTPPFNCDLNVIELVWSDIKRTLRDQNVDQDLMENVKRAKQIMSTYSADQWRAHMGHVKKLEQSYWDGDLAFENVLDQYPDAEDLALNAESDDSYDDSDWDDED